MKAPAFQWYVNDFLSSGRVALMSLEEIGAYTVLLNRDWSEGGLPAALAPYPLWLKVARKRADRLWEAIRPNFVLHEGRWYNPRLEKERTKQDEWREKSSRGGKAGSDARWHKGGHKMVKECLLPNDDTTSSSSSTSNYTPDFELVWAVLPKKPGANKKQTFRLFRGHLKAGIDFDVIYSGAQRYAAYCMSRGWIGTEWVKAPQVFMGRDMHFLAEWDAADLPKKLVAVGGEPTADELKSLGIRL